MRRNSGFSLLELLLVVAIILIIAAIAIPQMLRARISANEAAAVSAMRSVTSAQIIYKITYPQVGYADDLSKLGPSDSPTSDRANLIPADLADAPNQKSGYLFSMTADADNFVITATPASPGVTGARSFCTDTPAVLYWAAAGEDCAPGTNAFN